MKGVSAEIKHLRRKKIFRRIVYIFLLLVFAVCAGLISLFFIDALKIKDIEIKGAIGLDESEIRTEAGNILKTGWWNIVPKDRFFSFSRKELEKKLLDKFKKIEKIDFSRKSANKLEINIEERQPVALLCLAGEKDCFFVDKNTYIFEKAPFFSGGVFLKFFDEREKRPGLGEYFLEGTEARRVLSFKDALSRNMQITEIWAKKDGIYNFYTADGWYLIAETGNDFSEVYANLVLVFDEIAKEGKVLEYVDLRFGNKIFYKYKFQPEPVI